MCQLWKVVFLFFHSLYFRPVFLNSKCISAYLAGYGWVLIFLFLIFFIPISDSLYLLIGLFGPFIFNILTDTQLILFIHVFYICKYRIESINPLLKFKSDPQISTDSAFSIIHGHAQSSEIFEF